MEQKWLKISIILGIFGFFKEFRPSEPFVTEFLLGEWRNVTEQQIYKEVYPIATYSHLVMLVAVLFVTDLLRYKPVIVASSCAAIAIYCMLLWTTSLLSLQILEVFYGFYRAAEVAYFTYMYSKVDKDKYQKVTGNARAAHLSGRFISSIVAQFLYSLEVIDVRQLNYLTLGAQLMSLVVAVLLPYAPQSQAKKKQKKSSKSSKNILSSVKSAYSNSVVLKWTLYWIFGTAAYMMLHFYEHILWSKFESHNSNFSPTIEAFQTLFSLMAAFYAGSRSIKTVKKYDFIILGVFSLLQGIFAMMSAYTKVIWMVYFLYVMFGVIYNFLITIATASVAYELSRDNFGLVFGINTLLAIGMQTFVTYYVKNFIGTDVRTLIMIFGWKLTGMGGIFIIFAARKCLINCCGQNRIKKD